MIVRDFGLQAVYSCHWRDPGLCLAAFPFGAAPAQPDAGRSSARDFTECGGGSLRGASEFSGVLLWR